MSAGFTAQLRARKRTIQLAPEGTANAITLRVEMPEVWDTVRIVASPDERAVVVKQRALEALFPEAEFHQDFVLKLRGWEILDEAATLGESGIANGSILLLTHRRRRPVR